MKNILSLGIFILITSATLGQAFTSEAKNPFPKTIDVTGSAELEIVPDEIYVQVVLNEYEKKGNGKIALETIKSAFLSACKEAGIPDTAISVASYEGYDRWYWRKRKKNPDLNATITYEIKFSNTPQIDALVDRLDDEATGSFSIVRTSHSRIIDLRRQLKTLAVKAAKEKGIYLSEAIGEKLGEAIKIEEPAEVLQPDSRGFLSNSIATENKFKDAIPTQTAYKKIKLRYEVNVLFALK